MAKWQDVTCHYCRDTFRRKVRSSRDSAKYCSRGCSFKAQNILKKERMIIRRIGAEMRKKRRTIDVINRRQARAEKYGAYIEEALKCICKDCGLRFKQETHLGVRKMYCESCRAERQLEVERKTRRVARSRRRALIRGTKTENIDPIKVFIDADWRCYICGDNTPISLRGTFEDKAPELDHIIPLSKGGTHTLDNVACACRSCNNTKSDKLLPTRVPKKLTG